VLKKRSLPLTISLGGEELKKEAGANSVSSSLPPSLGGIYGKLRLSAIVPTASMQQEGSWGKEKKRKEFVDFPE